MCMSPWNAYVGLVTSEHETSSQSALNHVQLLQAFVSLAWKERLALGSVRKLLLLLELVS